MMEKVLLVHTTIVAPRRRYLVYMAPAKLHLVSLCNLEGSYKASLKGFYLTPSETRILDEGYTICKDMGRLHLRYVLRKGTPQEELWLERLISLLAAILNEDHDGFRAVMQTDTPQSEPPVVGAPELPYTALGLDNWTAHDVLLTPFS